MGKACYVHVMAMRSGTLYLGVTKDIARRVYGTNTYCGSGTGVGRTKFSGLGVGVGAALTTSA